jgi:hypothetical protein
MYAHKQADRREVKSLSPLLINTIWSVLNASKHEKRKRETEMEIDRLPGKLHSALEHRRFYCKQHQNDNGHIFRFQDSTLLTRKPG